MNDVFTDQALNEFIAGRIKQALQDAGMTYESAGEHVGVSKPAVGKWTKTGRIELANLYRLATVTGKPIQFFFPENDGPPSGQELRDLRADIDLARSSGNGDLLDGLLLEILEAKRALKDA